MSITHRWEGSTLVITSDSGTSSMDLRGPEGPMGVRGPQGIAFNETGIDIDTGLRYTTNTCIENGDLVTTVTYDAATIDTIQYRGMSLRNIFGNSIIQNGDFEYGEFPYFDGNTTEANAEDGITITNECSDTGNHSLALTPNGSSRFLRLGSYTFSQGHTYFIAFRARVDEYTQGQIGYQGIKNTYAPTILSGKAFTSVTRYLEPLEKDITQSNFIGCMKVSSLDNASPILKAYIDNFVILDLTSIFGEDNVPRGGTMRELYDLYIHLQNDEKLTKKYIISKESSGSRYTDEECVNRFVQEMNSKAAAIHMTNSKFHSASGLPLDLEEDNDILELNNVSTAADMMKLGVIAFGHPELVRVMNVSSWNSCIKGPNARSLALTAAMPGNSQVTPHRIIGGKGGSLNAYRESLTEKDYCGIKNYYLTVEVSGVLVGICIAGMVKNEGNTCGLSVDEVYPLIQDVCDVMAQILSGTNKANVTVPATLNAAITRADHAIGVAACVLPHNIASYENYPTSTLLAKDTSYTANENKIFMPASVSKMLTGILVCENVDDLYETVEVKESDLISGSGMYLEAGDIITIKELLYIMLIPSSNQAAQVLARVIGQKLLERK